LRVLITGGAGYIGSVAVERALATGHEVGVVDSLWRGHRLAVPTDSQFFEVDLRDPTATSAAVASFRPDAILHFAGATLVPESMTDPLLYFDINVVGSHNLIAAAIAADVPKFVFSSTAATYGDISADVITEDLATNPINPYGRSKLMVEQMLEWHSKIHGMHVAIFRYFNVAGATVHRGEDHTPETHVIPVALDVIRGRRAEFTVFGTDYSTSDGTCIRDYVHVIDLTDAHLLALEWLEANQWGIFNLGTEFGSSVQEIVRAVEMVTDRTLPVVLGARREGDPPRLVASSVRARTELGWKPTHSTLDQMVGSAWDWFGNHPNGYEDK
jgi:UDP-glucose 4-epimerase